MHKRLLLNMLATGCLTLVALADHSLTRGDEPAASNAEKPLREIFIPFEDLEAVLAGNTRRVFLERVQYEDLLAKVKTAPEVHAPRPFVLLATHYDCQIEGQRARVLGTFEIESLQEDMQAVPIHFGALKISQAALDDQPASLGNAGVGNVLLFVAGKGIHKLVVELLASAPTGVAEQSLMLHLPQGAAQTFSLHVPGDVELKAGATVLRRETLADENHTRFELLLPRGPTSLLMTLNNRLLADDRAVLARSVLVSELTEVYERLHATVSLEVAHGVVEQMRFALPSNLEITRVDSPLVARWEVRPGESPTLDVTLREPLATRATLSITGSRPPAEPAEWEFPRLTPLDVAGQVAVVGLLLESRLKPVRLEGENLIAIGASSLGETLAASGFQVDPGAPPLRAVAAYYAPQSEYRLSAALEKPPARLWATTNVLLTLHRGQLEAQGGFALLPLAERIFECDVEVPAGWYLDRLTYGDAALEIEPYPQPNGTTRVHARLPQAVEPGVTYHLVFHATSTPAGWLGEWRDRRRSLPFPVFRVIDAARDVGAIAVQTRDDLAVRPGELDGLLPLDEARKGEFGLAGIPTALAYRYEKQPYSAELVAERLPSRQTARVFSFFRVSPDQIATRFELNYEITEADASTLKLLLPGFTPPDIAIRGLDNLELKGYEAVEVKSGRLWTVHLAKQRAGQARLAVEFDLPFDAAKNKPFALPLAAAADVVYQSGIAAIEGDAELELSVSPGEARGVDVGELVDAEYQPGKRLLGVYGYVGAAPQISIDATRHDPHGLPVAIVERSELVTVVAASGASQTAARFQLRTKAPFLDVLLPPGATLWAAVVDGAPAKPQKSPDGRLLLSLPARPASALRDLRIVYELPIRSLGLWSKVRAPAPELTLRSGGGSAPLPTADLLWSLYMPSGYQLVKSDGTVFTSELEERRGGWLMDLANRASDDLRIDHYGIQFAKALATRGERFASAPMSASDPAYDRDSELDGVTGAMPEAYYLAESAEMPTEELHLEILQNNGESAASEVAQEQLKMDLKDGAFEAQREARAEPKPRTAAPTAPPLPGRAKVAQGRALPVDDAPAKAAPTNNNVAIAGGLNLNGSGTAGGIAPDEKWEASSVSSRYRQTQSWALEGLRSLRIDLQPTGDAVRFTSLGDSPELSVTLIDRRRTDLLSLAVGLGVLLIGLALTRRATRTKLRFVLGVLLATTIIPLATGWGAELGYSLDTAFYAALVLIPYYLAIALGRRLLRRVSRFTSSHRWSPAGMLGLVASLAMLLCIETADAQQPTVPLAPTAPSGAAQGGVASEPTSAALTAKELDDEPLVPVNVPVDAILIPYDADDEQGVSKATRLMVPYDKYVSLWNRAYPNKRLDARPLPAQFGLAGARLKATLGDGDTLEMQASIQLDLFADDDVAIPLPLAGGVIVRAELDGQSARMKIVEALAPAMPVPQASFNVAPGTNSQPSPSPATAVIDPQEVSARIAQQQSPRPQPSQAVPQVAAPPRSFLMVYARGQGRKNLELVVRYPLTRQGGWRIATGRLPAATATTLLLQSPRSATEVRLTSAGETSNFETKQDHETIATALDASGEFRLEWRPRVGEAMIDRGLTVDSQAVFDVQEDGLRLLWQLGLGFRHSQREQFHLQLPNQWLIENIVGGNVRGWTTEETETGQRVTVTLLKAAQGGETLALRLSQRQAVGLNQVDEFNIPDVRVEDAALETGKLLIRRSPLLEVRALEATGAGRLNLEEVDALGKLATVAESPLGIRPFQAYRFISLPYQLKLSAQAAPAPVTARVQTLLKIAEQDRRVETRVAYQSAQRAVYRLRVAVPTGLELDEPIVPGAFEWVVRPEANRQVVEIMLADGRRGDFSIVLSGVLEAGEMAGALALPAIEVLDVESQSGEIAVQADPALEAQPRELKLCERVGVRQVDSWLQAEQRSTVQFALAYRAAGYSGVLSVGPRQGRVVASAVTNMRVTERTLEETMLLEFQISGAGTRELSFQMPASMRDARVRVPLLREKVISDVSPETVRVRLTLQDAVMGQVRVLVENDRLPEGDEYHAPIPAIENAETEQRFITLESSGRDEILVARRAGLEPVDREQALWRKLTALLPDGNITQAFVVAPGAKSPELVLKPERRDVVKTTQARIGLAETVLVVDAAGAYRATQSYRVDNATEQHLDIRLPPGAQLWTARVADLPVKPAKTPGQADQVRIPLVKTAAGDQDFVVELKYGGRITGWGGVSTVSFPLPRTVNIQVDQSQVRLWLPEQFRWFDFGGSMGMVSDEGDLLAGFLAYKNRQIQKLMESLSESGSYSSVRAKGNLKQVEQELEELTAQSQRYIVNSGYAKQLDSNKRFLDEAQSQIRAEESKAQVVEENFNRLQLNDNYIRQNTQRSSNVVNNSARNFSAATATEGREKQSEFRAELFQDQFPSPPDEHRPDASEKQPRGETPPTDGEGKPGKSSGKGYGLNTHSQVDQPRAADAFKEVDLAQSGEGEWAPQSRTQDGSGGRAGDLRRYEQQLAMQQGKLKQQQDVVKALRGKSLELADEDHADVPQQQAGQLRDRTIGRDETRLPGQEFVGSSLGDGLDGGVITHELASLDVEIPRRGVEYLFSTPRGDVEITARAISRPVSNRLARLLIVGMFLVVSGWAYRRWRLR